MLATYVTNGIIGWTSTMNGEGMCEEIQIGKG
jgi:hypothetical protein